MRISSHIPPEVIRATIRANQKCFVLRDPPTAGLANKFILRRQYRGAATAAPRSPPAMAALCGRGCPMRNSSTRPIFNVKLEDRLAKLDDIVFHEKLGTQGERVEAAHPCWR